MALISKTFFNFTTVENEAVDDMSSACFEHFGKMTVDVEREMDAQKNNTFRLNPRFIAESYGRSMSINSSTILWEEDFPFDNEENNDLILGALMSYIQRSTGKEEVMDFDGSIPEKVSKNEISLGDVKKAREKFMKLYGEDLTIGVKMIKLGNVEYYGYCLKTSLEA